MQSNSRTRVQARRILAIKPDADRAQLLRQLLCTSNDIDLEIVSTAAEAIQSISAARPDLLMVSTFLAPAEEAALRAFVRQLPGARLEIIEIPYFITDTRSENRSARVLQFLGRRAPIRPHCDARTLREQIEQYFRRLNADRDLHDRWGCLSGPSIEPAFTATATPAAGSNNRILRADSGNVQTVLSQRTDRRRARRKPPTELPWLWALKLPHSSSAQVVDISTSGVLIETPTKILPGTMLDVELVGREFDLRVPARMLRTQVADVDSLGVKYRVAAAFAKRLDLPGLDSGGSAIARLTSASDLLKPLLACVDRAGASADALAAFETELRRLLPVQDIEIRHAPLIPKPGTESIYFTVPTGPQTTRILQVTFEPGQVPSEMEFTALKTAAILAGAVIALATNNARSTSRLTA